MTKVGRISTREVVNVPNFGAWTTSGFAAVGIRPLQAAALEIRTSSFIDLPGAMR
jgi:hypothetical protein